MGPRNTLGVLRQVPGAAIRKQDEGLKTREDIIAVEQASGSARWRGQRWTKKLQVHTQTLLDGGTEGLICYRTDWPSKADFINGPDLMCQDERFLP